MDPLLPFITSKRDNINHQTKRQGVNSQHICHKIENDTFSTKFNNEDSAYELLTGQKKRCCDHEIREEVKAESNNINHFELNGPTIPDFGVQMPKHIINKTAVNLTTQTEALKCFNNCQNVSQSVLKPENCSNTSIVNTSHVVDPLLKNTLEKQSLEQSSRLLANKQEHFSNDIQKYAVESVSNLSREKDHGISSENETESIKLYCAPLPDNIASKLQSTESRPIYPNVPYSPYSSPFDSPRSSRQRPTFRESRRISIEKSGSFLQLNQYKLMEQIGQGSYGLVKLAYSEEDSTHYAMKILSKKRLLRQAGLMRRGPKKATSPLDRVYREIAVLKKLDHPNVVKLVEVLDDPLEDSLYMVFELVKQGEVLRIPTEKPLSEKKALSIFRETLLGLEYLHFQKIIHADIKPGNLLLTESGHVKIADLGVCNEFFGEDANISNESTSGTPAFRAPETLILGQTKYCGKAADVWSLGATLYSLVFGNVPFLANSVPLLYDKIKRDSVVFPEHYLVSENLKSCITQMLEKDAMHRITVPQLKTNKWVTSGSQYSLPTEEENCMLVQVDDKDMRSVIHSIPKLDTLILIKTMLKKHSFGNPFVKGSAVIFSGPNESRISFVRAGRSNSAPASCHMLTDRQPSADALLPSLTEHCPDQSNEDKYNNIN